VGLAFGGFVVVATGWPPVAVLGFTMLGALYPFIWLRDQVKKRHQAILSDLPYHLDLLTLCVEAGMDFGAAVNRMVEKGKPGALREEFATFLAQLRVGKTRAEALQEMAERVGLEQLATFLSALVQADRMGSGLGATLRLQADQMRIERFQRAEKLAGEAPVKMLIPLVLFIFPTIWVILGAPLVFDWIFRGGP
jgi:tight adherence protein C